MVDWEATIATQMGPLNGTELKDKLSDMFCEYSCISVFERLQFI